jgi:hypothetical protein
VLVLVLDAGIAQLVEHNLAKVGVAGSSPVSRSLKGCQLSDVRCRKVRSPHTRLPISDIRIQKGG